MTGARTSGGTNNIIFGTNSSGTTASHQVDANTGTTSTITGNITANGYRTGVNTITFYNDGVINGTITAGSGGYQGTNTITFNKNATIGNASEGKALTTSTSSLIADNTSNNYTAKTNTLTFNGTTNSVTFNEVKTLGHGNTKNILKFTNGTSTVTINSITATNGVNHITKNDQMVGADCFKGTIKIGRISSSGNNANNTIRVDSTSTMSTINDISLNTIGDISADNNSSNTIELKAATGKSNTVGKIYARNSRNQITADNLVFNNSNGERIIDADGGSASNTITSSSTLKIENKGDIVARWGGTNTITANSGTTITNANLLAGMDRDNSQASYGKNILVLKGVSNTITLKAVQVYGNNSYNSIAKVDLSAINSNSFTFSPVSSESTHQRGVASPQAETQTDIASEAMVGTLQISNGVSGNNSGWNNIAFQASANQATPVIQKLKEVTPAEQSPELPSQKTLHFKEGGKTLELDTAISGNANIYLDMSKVDHAFGGVTTKPEILLQKLSLQDASAITDTLSKSAILGHVDNIGGQQNIYIKGKGDNAGLTLGLTGNIINGNGNGGTMNIIFEDSFWTPYAVINGGQGSTTGVGGIVTTNSTGKTNIVLRKSSTTSVVPGVGAYDASTTAMPVYKVVSQQGETNIVMQGNIAASSYISYTNGGSVNLIFANSNDNQADSYTSGNTDASQNKILGKTYKDGVKLALHDKQILVGDTRQSFLNTYGHYFSTHDEGSLLNVTATRMLTDSGSSKTQTDSVYIKGLALGNISALTSSNGGEVAKNGTTYNYNVVLGAHSAFVGDMKLQDNAVIDLIMEDSSKLLTDVEHLKLKTLTLKSQGYNTNEMLLDTFAQNNTIIDIATMGDALGNLTQRSAFRLLEIGDASGAGAGVGGVPGVPGVAGYAAAAAASGASGVKGLQGSGALFRVYVNANADQGTQSNVQNRENSSLLNSNGATLGGSSGASKGGSGEYGYVYSDRIIIHDGSTTINNGQAAQQNQDKVNYIQTIYDTNIDINKLTYHGGGSETEGNIAVATVKTSSGIKFQGATQIQGFDEVGTTLTSQTTDQYGKVKQTSVGAGEEKQASNTTAVAGVNRVAASEAEQATSGNGDYTTYFISSVESKGASVANQLATATALGLNYELFLANFNSLNKRMGELRNNDNGQGAWGRIFNGMLTTSYGLEAKSVYTTIQAGYDYAFGFEGANNYLGVALSYANSVIKPKGITDIDGYSKGIDKSISNAVELAVYNSYVEDSGWFNDTIFKFSYIMSSINMSGQSSEYDTNNYGIVFSDEFGYRFKLGNDQEWYIDPQLELSFGYFNQSDLKQVLGQASLTGIQDSIINLRSRVGVNWSYDFKRFTQGKGIKASVYLGTYYAYDYIEGGDISLMTNLGKGVNLQALASTGRFEMNIGTNVEIKDNTRLYFDFERSFGGDITTDYQVNLGVRYSFGESNGYTPISAIKTKIAPLKVGDEKPQEQPSQENTSSEEKTDTNKTEQKAQ